MPLIQRKGAQSSQGFGEFAQSTAATYIEDVFSTYLYTGTGSTQTITNGIDLSTKGGLVWTKRRSGSAVSHALLDTVRGGSSVLTSDDTSAAFTAAYIPSFSSTGYTLDGGFGRMGTPSETYASWTFRKQAKFFDIVTYTGNGSSNRQISHNLGSTPGCIIVKRTDTTASWVTYHNGLSSANYAVFLNYTNAQTLDSTYWNGTAPTSTNFTVGSSGSTNQSGGNFVAYLFASNAGGFGSDGTQNVITCGSFTTAAGTGLGSVNLGWEPQCLIFKRSDGVENWMTRDSMRALNQTGYAILYPNTTGSEVSGVGQDVIPTATGFNAYLNASATYIYIAIRRGPMKTPTVGTSVFSPIAGTLAYNSAQTTGFPVDMQWTNYRTGYVNNTMTVDRLRGASSKPSDTATSYPVLSTASTAAENTGLSMSNNWNNTGFNVPSTVGGGSDVFLNFQRAPGFFDVVCYTGTGTSSFTQSHNLGVSPELIILRRRNSISTNVDDNWVTWSTGLTSASYQMFLNVTLAQAASYNITFTRSSTTFGNSASVECNRLSATYVAYLFASVTGVSKVGSYTGTAAAQTIDCGFAAGARFVMIKRTDSTGDWYVWDTARGMVSGTDPYSLLDSTAAEVNANNVYTTGVGFQIVGTGAGINASGGTYIYLAIA